MNSKRYQLLITTLFFSALFLHIELHAQKNPWFTSKDNMAGTRVYYELFGGISSPSMIYSNSNYNNAVRTTQILPELGLSARFQFKKWVSLIPRFSYAQQGVSFQNGNNYTLTTNNVNFSLPVELQLQIGKRNLVGATRIFFFAGPYIGIPFSGKITSGDFSSSLEMSDLTYPDYGIEGGLGIRIPTFSLESRSFLNIRLSYTRGFADTYSAAESEINPAMNERLYLDGGERFNGGFKLILGIEIPKKSKKVISFTAGGDGKKNYKKAVIVDEK